jgi:hypothetical protein
MNDAAWLPSAIMQTTAALVGIFAVVYVLAVQEIDRLISRDAIPKYFPIIVDIMFSFMLVVSILTIFANYILLSETTIGIKESSNIRIWLKIRANNLFEGTLFLIFWYTISLIIAFRNPFGKLASLICRYKIRNK